MTEGLLLHDIFESMELFQKQAIALCNGFCERASKRLSKGAGALRCDLIDRMLSFRESRQAIVAGLGNSENSRHSRAGGTAVLSLNSACAGPKGDNPEPP